MLHGFVAAEANNNFEDMYATAISKPQNKQIWMEMEKRRFETKKVEKGQTKTNVITEERQQRSTR